MPIITVKDNEYFDFALRRFKRSCEKAGILNEYRKREFYEKPTQERKRKKAAAVKRERSVSLENATELADFTDQKNSCLYSLKSKRI